MKTKKVKIIKSSPPFAWYKELIGEVFLVYVNRKNFILKEDYDSGHGAIWRHIVFQDCKIIE